MSISFKDALKAKKIREFFNQHGRIYIVVDAASNDVQVPEFLQGDPALRLVLNTRMPQPIHIRDSFIESNFSFSGESHACIIPMCRIWATYLPGGDMSTGTVWEDDVPESIQSVMGAVRELKGDAEPEQAVLATKLEGEVGSEPEIELAASKQSESEPAKEEHGRKVGHLRVVK